MKKKSTSFKSILTFILVFGIFFPLMISLFDGFHLITSGETCDFIKIEKELETENEEETEKNEKELKSFYNIEEFYTDALLTVKSKKVRRQQLIVDILFFEKITPPPKSC